MRTALQGQRIPGQTSRYCGNTAQPGGSNEL